MQEASEIKITIRPAKLEDLNFIFASWLKSYRYASMFAKKISNEVYYEWHHKVIERFIERNGTVSIAHPVGEPEVILGFIAHDGGDILQYIYVKKTFRQMGIAKALLGDMVPKTFTHWTRDTDWMIKKMPEIK